MSDIFRFAFLCIRTVESNFCAVTVVCPKLFALAARVVANQLIRRTQNILRRAIILFQSNGHCVFILSLKFQNICDGCAAELVNALIVITDNTDVLISACQQAGQYILCMVGILILVRHNIMELSLIALQNVRIALQQLHSFHNNIIKVHGIGFFELLCILFVNFCYSRLVIILCIFYGVHARRL